MAYQRNSGVRVDPKQLCKKCRQEYNLEKALKIAMSLGSSSIRCPYCNDEKGKA